MGKTDAAYRRLFQHKALLRDLMACALPPTLFDALDWDRMEPIPTSYISDRLRQRFGDGAWRIPYRTPPQPPGSRLPRYLYVLLLFEHQNEPDAIMALRAASYAGLLYQSLLRDKQIQLPLPPVLPVVLYSGDKPWRAAPELSGLIAAVPEELRPYQLQMRYLLIEERALLRASGLPEDNRAALLVRMGASRDVEEWRALLHTLMKTVQGPGFEELNRSLTSWLLHVAQSNAAPDEALPAVNTLEELDMMISEKPGVWAQQWKQEGIQIGLQKGHADLLLRQIERRFGPQPAAVTERIRAAPESQLSQWALNILDAETLGEVFGD